MPSESLSGAPAAPTSAITWSSEWVRKGDTLSAIFKRAGQSQTTLHRLLQAEGLDREFRRLQPGDEVRFRVDDDELLELAYTTDALSTLYVTREGDRWVARDVVTPTEVRTRFVGGVIQQSLYVSALQAGLNDRLIMELVGIFGWDVDFALDIRAGDRFGLIHEEIYAEDGTKLADGAILAASFTNQGRDFHAVRFADATGTPNFFAPDGYSMRKAFLRSPVDFRRISSRFRGSRYHPVLGVKRPHRGVDYAASRGTPVKASGDGKVIHAARKGGYGKTVILQHGGRYRTLYAHLNGYARGIKTGTRVRQGQTIGYVGATGLATGPHLHYEFLVDGVHRNPLTVDLPKADPLEKRLLPDFRAVVEPLLAQLAVHAQTLVAQNEP
jgi:murein DD-endopeptidase MepM/ murein hydrolase activator NlpD